MNHTSYLAHRAAFCGVPSGELLRALELVRGGTPWEAAFLASARRLRRLGEAREARESATSAISAAEAWIRAASAYQVASFGMHLDPERSAWNARALRQRRLAELCYRRGLALDPARGRRVALSAVGLSGYLRRPTVPLARGPVGTVVLVNGLDSICEVELCQFGERFLDRGFATLALGLPAAPGPERGPIDRRAERLASGVADWIEDQPDLADRPIVAFGVSFGGHVVARLLAGDGRFTAGVAVSAPARLDTGGLTIARIRRMFALMFDLANDREIEVAAAELNLAGLPRPEGKLLALHMEDDQVFGLDHLEALCAWGGDRVQVRRYPGEHVGTSNMHCWLPEACDWLIETLSEFSVSEFSKSKETAQCAS